MRRSNGCTKPRPDSVEVEPADDRGVAALEDADDAALEPVLDRPTLDAREHAVAVHRFLDVAGRNVDVGRVAAGLVGNDEAEAGRVRLQAADDEVHLVGQPDAAAFGLHELARRDERFQKAAERRAFFLRNLESFDELARRRGMRDLSRINFRICSLDNIDLNIAGLAEL